MFKSAMLAACLVASAVSVAQVNPEPKPVPAARPAVDSAAGLGHRRERFRQIDANGDGKLSLEEFEHRPEANGTVRAVEAAELKNRADRFKQGDTNNDGVLSLEEFIHLQDMPLPGRP